jgi:hypothetical protein
MGSGLPPRSNLSRARFVTHPRGVVRRRMPVQSTWAELKLRLVVLGLLSGRSWPRAFEDFLSVAV